MKQEDVIEDLSYEEGEILYALKALMSRHEISYGRQYAIVREEE